MKRFAVAAFFVSLSASAQETTHGGAVPEIPSHPDHFIDRAMQHSWSEGKPRLFAATTIDVGYLYMRPRGHIGYGMPFNTWVGIEANPLIGLGGWGGYGGIRFALPNLDLRIGARQFNAFRHAFLTPKESYDRLDLDITEKDAASYYTIEAEATGSFQAGPGDVLIMGSVSGVGGVPLNSFVFEETLRVVVDPPWVWRARGGYLLRFGVRDQHSIGPVLDFLHVPGRDDSRTIRVGPVLRIQLSRHFDVRGSFVTTILSPDRLGLVGSDFTELGVRYRTSSE